MSDFYRRFLAEDPRKMGGASGRAIFLAAFGKHPGWDDHVEDLGLETESLIFAKTLLYVQGIGGQIDSGAWEKLDAAQQLPGFKHIFLWERQGHLLLGRLWSSSDGKGRTRYPLIVCAHCVGLPLEWALENVLPRLEQLEQACAQASSAAQVRGALERQRNELRAAIASVPASARAAFSSAALSEFVNHPALGPEKEGWFRILYQMQSQFAPFASGRFSVKGDLSSLRPQQMRVPATAASPTQALLLWHRFFQAHLDPAVPLLFSIRLDEGWLDITAGEPGPHELFALRASPRAMPLANEVPYNLEPAFREKAHAQLAAFAGDTAMKVRPVAASKPASEPATSGGSKLLRWLGGAAVVMAIAAVAVVLSSGKKSEPPIQVAATKSAETVAQPPASPSPVTQAPDPQVQAKAEAGARAHEAQAKQMAEARAKAEAEARARAESEAKALAEAKAQAEARARAEAKARAEEEARRVAMAAEAERRREAEAATKAAAAAIASTQTAPAVEQAKAPAPVLTALATPASTRPASTAPLRHFTNSVGIQMVSLADDLWAGKYEITRGQYGKVIGTDSAAPTINPQHPMQSVTWEEAREFCRKLTEIEKAAGTLAAGFAYDLPTQAQWDSFLADADFEKAVTSRKGTRRAPEPVGTLAPNKLGLHDVLGNVWEWCADGSTNEEKTARGGAYNNLPTFRYAPLQPSTIRRISPKEKKSIDVGFRCVLARAQ